MAKQNKDREYGDGTIYPSADKKAFVAQISIKGKIVRRRRATRAAAELALAELRALRNEGVDIHDGSQSVEAFSNYWYNEDVLQRDIKPRTATHYLRTLERYVLTAIGARRVMDVSHGELQTLLNDLRRRRRPLSPQTVKHVKSVLEQLFTCAKKNHLVKENPALDLVAPAVKRDPKEALTAQQVQCFLESITHYRLAAAYHIMASMGLRLGEVLAIRRIDIDFDNAILTIREATNYETTEADSPKSESAKRPLPIPPHTLAAMRAQWDTVKPAADWKEHGLLFPSEVGTRKAPRAFEREWHGQEKTMAKGRKLHIKGLRERGGLPEGTTIHDFRRFVATELGSMDINPMTIKHILGHEAGDVTELYIKRRLPSMRRALEAVEQVIWGDVGHQDAENVV